MRELQGTYYTREKYLTKLKKEKPLTIQALLLRGKVDVKQRKNIY